LSEADEAARAPRRASPLVSRGGENVNAHRLTARVGCEDVGDSVTTRRLGDLRAMSKADIVAAHDEMVTGATYVMTPEDYGAELARRDTSDQTALMLRLTWLIAALTVVNLAFVIYSAVH
jgi:hypothetical protein